MLERGAETLKLRLLAGAATVTALAAIVGAEPAAAGTVHP
jgi:hypothetical protein